MKKIKIIVGSPYYDYGQTIVSITGDGLVEATNVRDKERPMSVRLDLDNETSKGVFSSIANKAGKIPSSKGRRGVPDEAEYLIEITRDDGKTSYYQLWDNDLSKDKELKTAFKLLRESILKHSDQKIML